MSIHSKSNEDFILIFNGSILILFQDVINVNEHQIHREELFVQHDEQSWRFGCVY